MRDFNKNCSSKYTLKRRKDKAQNGSIFVFDKDLGFRI